MSKDNFEFEVYIKEAKIGKLKRLEKTALDRLGIKNKQVFALEIALEKIFPFVQINKKFTPLTKYPGALRDISLVLKEDTPVEEVIKVIVRQGGRLLQKVETTDYYKGKQIESGFKGLTISCFYASSERTLTEAEINPIHTRIVQGLKDQLQVKIRS